MNARQIVDQIQLRATGRFQVKSDESLLSLASESLHDIGAIKLHRIHSKAITARTVLVASIAEPGLLKTVSSWAAEVRDALLEPETSDLYLFLVAAGISYHDCSRIEADEQFCRKYVVGSMADVSLMLDRTFLASFSHMEATAVILDPVNAAFQNTEAAYGWLNKTFQDQWLEAFLSEKAGKDLVPQIIAGTAVGEEKP